MHCRLCNLKRRLVKSHIIPKAFFRELWNTNDTPRIFSGADNTPHRRSPIGVYDSTILCRPCEATFNAVDGYGITVLLKQRAFFQSNDFQMMANIASRSLLNDPPLKPCKITPKS
jgi:hypothetical protein